MPQSDIALSQDLQQASIASSARRRISRRIVPYLFLLYVIAFLDRVNVGYANLQMTDDLGFSPEIFGFGAGIFFIGYFFFEIPGSLIVETWSARGWIARIMITWGVLATGMGFIQTAQQFYWMRFFLGVAEAGFFPGLLVYLSHWFRQEDRGKAVAMLMSAVPISSIIGAPLSGLLLNSHWLDRAGWRWLFIFEGIPAVIFGVVTIFYLTDRPKDAKWLPEQERAWLVKELETERQTKASHGSLSIWATLAQRDVILLAIAYFGMVNGLYGFNIWLPTIFKQLSGLGNFATVMLSAIPYCIGLIAMVLIGWSSDKRSERRWHTALPMAVAAIGLLCSALLQAQIELAVVFFCVAAIGVFGHLPSFWANAYSRYSGIAAAAAIGLINSFGNLGGFVGPYIIGYINNTTHSFVGGIMFLSAMAALSATAVLALRKNA